MMHHIDAVVYPITHVHIPMPRLPKQGVVARGTAAVYVASGLALAISLCLHNHAPQQLPTGLTLEQQATNQLWCHLLGGTAEELWG